MSMRNRQNKDTQTQFMSSLVSEEKRKLKIVSLLSSDEFDYWSELEPVWPVKSRQIALKVAQ